MELKNLLNPKESRKKKKGMKNIRDKTTKWYF